jgi:hypothetical protein
MRAVSAEFAPRREPLDWHAADEASLGSCGRGLQPQSASGAEGFLTQGPHQSPDAATPMGRLAIVERGVTPGES